MSPAASAAGGGRCDYGMLARAERVWVSDSNDALDRFDIQAHANLFLPPEVCGVHVGPASCHITGRRLSLDLRAHTAAAQDVIEFAVPHTLAFTFFPHWLMELRQHFKGAGAFKTRLTALNVHDAVLRFTEGACDLLIATFGPDKKSILSAGTHVGMAATSSTKMNPTSARYARRPCGCADCAHRPGCAPVARRSRRSGALPPAPAAPGTAR